MTKLSKLFLNDTGLIAQLNGLTADRFAGDPKLWGSVLETFVVLELCKRAVWEKTPVRAYHFRTHSGQEVDVVLEDAAERLVGIEVRAAASAWVQPHISQSACVQTSYSEFRWRGKIAKV